MLRCKHDSVNIYDMKFIVYRLYNDIQANVLTSFFVTQAQLSLND